VPVGPARGAGRCLGRPADLGQATVGRLDRRREPPTDTMGQMTYDDWKTTDFSDPC